MSGSASVAPHPVSGAADHVVRNAMTVDVEDYFHVSAFAGTIRPENWGGMEYRAETNTHKLLELFAEYGLRATFFVLGWVARRSPALVRQIHADGHEVACHGMSHQLVYRQTAAEFREESLAAKNLLEDVIGAPVEGYRAASWSVTRESLWALDILQELGFKYDSSVFPIRHDRYGIPGASPHPGLIDTPGGRQIVEFPPSTVDLLNIVRLPVAGGGYFRLFPYWLTRAGLKQLNQRARRPFIFYLHPWEVDVHQPRIRAGWLSRFRHYTNLDKTAARLRMLVQEFAFTTARDVLGDLRLLPPT